MSTQARHIPIREDWLAKTAETAIAPDQPIVDAHHHLWYKPDGRSYLLKQLRKDIVGSGHRVVATVAVEASHNYRNDVGAALASLGETEQALQAALASHASGLDVAAGIVGYADLTLGTAVGDLLDRHTEAAQGHFRGIRNTSAWHANPDARGSAILPSPGLLYDTGLRVALKELSRRGLVFEAWMYHTQLLELIDLAHDNPDLTIVLDHQGGPLGIGPYAGRRQEVFRDWLHFIRRLAKFENVHVKLGGLGMFMAGFDFHKQPSAPCSLVLAQAWSPYFLACIDAFGPARCMFESNFPVDKGSCSYGMIWNAYKRIIQDFSSDERDMLLYRTAKETYRLELGI